MRPRKKVLIFTAQELGAGVLIFVINNGTRYRARAVHTVEDFARELTEFAPDALLVCSDGADADLVLQIERDAFARDVATLRFGKRADRFTRGYATAVLGGAQVTMSEILHRLWLMCARKRGPKKKGSHNATEAILAGQHAAEHNERLLRA